MRRVRLLGWRRGRVSGRGCDRDRERDRDRVRGRVMGLGRVEGEGISAYHMGEKRVGKTGWAGFMSEAGL